MKLNILVGKLILVIAYIGGHFVKNWYSFLETYFLGIEGISEAVAAYADTN